MDVLFIQLFYHKNIDNNNKKFRAAGP